MRQLTRLFLALLPVLLLVGAWELTLRVTNDSPAGALHLSRGFDASARYLIPDSELPGVWRTQIFGGEHVASELTIPPKGKRPRVILLGGSNTELFPEFILQEALRARDSRAWEVINLGRRGYGSERVRILLDQAFVLAPDLLVIYSGHNEFVERGFATEIAERGAPGWMPQLRCVTQLSEWLKAARPPEALERRDPGLRSIQPEETTRHLQAYEANLRHMVAAAAARNIPVLLCTPLGNPLSAPYVDTLPHSIDETTAQRIPALLAEARGALPQRLFEMLRPVGAAPLRLRVKLWHRPTAFASQGPLASVPPARSLSGRFANSPELSRGNVQCDSMQGSHWPPVEQWQASTHQLLRAMVPLLARLAGPEELEQLQAIVPLYEQVLSLVPDHPSALYDLGLIRYLLDEDPAQAVELLHAAAAADRAPRAANDRTNGIVRRVASEASGTTLYDFEAEARAANADNLAGFELLMDNCHLQPGVRVVLMERLAEQLPALLN